MLNDSLIVNCPNDLLIRWQPWQNECIVENFSREGWHNISPEVKSDHELRGLLARDFVHIYVAYLSRTNCPIGFVLLIECGVDGGKISLHGGCWGKSAIANYTALVILIESLFKGGYKIRSSNTVGNARSDRYLRSVGFINYYKTKTYRYYWLPYKRFANTEIYKRIHNNNILNACR